MSQFMINDVTYDFGKLSAREQFHIARRLAPLVKGLGEVVATAGGVGEIISAAKTGQLGRVITKVDPFAIAQPLLDALASMSDEDADYIMDKCLAVTKRQDNMIWTPIVLNGVPMYQDMDYLVIMQIAYHVIQRNLVNFTRATA